LVWRWCSLSTTTTKCSSRNSTFLFDGDIFSSTIITSGTLHAVFTASSTTKNNTFIYHVQQQFDSNMLSFQDDSKLMRMRNWSPCNSNQQQQVRNNKNKNINNSEQQPLTSDQLDDFFSSFEPFPTTTGTASPRVNNNNKCIKQGQLVVEYSTRYPVG
jgi:hypothetical protein